LRIQQRPQPIVDPNWVFVHFTFCCHECTHLDWTIYTYVEAFGSSTLLGSVVLLYSHNVIQTVYTCKTFCCYLCTHCAWISSTAVHLYFSPDCVPSQTVYATTLYNCTLRSASLASHTILQNWFTDVR
jgi:hypothetical protein